MVFKIAPPQAPPSYNIITRLQNVRLKNLSFLAKSKIGIFACFFFGANLTVLGVLVGSSGE
jgi:hypothetical protein